MGEPIYLVRGDESMVVYGRHQAAVHVKKEGWLLAGESEAIVLPPTPIDATESATKLAKEHDINLLGMIGTGANGRVTLKDVRALVNDDS